MLRISNNILPRNMHLQPHKTPDCYTLTNCESADSRRNTAQNWYLLCQTSFDMWHIPSAQSSLPLSAQIKYRLHSCQAFLRGGRSGMLLSPGTPADVVFPAVIPMAVGRPSLIAMFRASNAVIGPPGLVEMTGETGVGICGPVGAAKTGVTKFDGIGITPVAVVGRIARGSSGSAAFSIISRIFMKYLYGRSEILRSIVPE